jgi:hypothetical protein
MLTLTIRKIEYGILPGVTITFSDCCGFIGRNEPLNLRRIRKEGLFKPISLKKLMFTRIF